MKTKRGGLTINGITSIYGSGDGPKSWELGRAKPAPAGALLKTVVREGTKKGGWQ